jgi:hypothetical protein
MSKSNTLKEIEDMMAYHSRVAKETVWFTWAQIWDIMKEADGYSKRSMARSFPSRQMFSKYAATNPNIIKKRIRGKETFEGLTSISRNKTTFYGYEEVVGFVKPPKVFLREIKK